MKKNGIFFLITIFLVLTVILVICFSKYNGIINLEKYKMKLNNLLINKQNYELEISEENKCIYDKEIKINVKINNFSENTKYKLVAIVNNQTSEFEIVSNECMISLPQNVEGKKQVTLNLYENDEIVENIDEE